MLTRQSHEIIERLMFEKKKKKMEKRWNPTQIDTPLSTVLCQENKDGEASIEERSR